ncbi:uncharacterized protein BCR38DRAFT_337972 [Pseudomassariella vexata]|uniref:Cupin 2 conserved barrel domain-containing protein n=1 Tax=Pseudomassariella vexata TaxID=1141098 RepID=A0A1Y2E8V0_9PEZI|nr:uncharacterized protein BCR38DRAFT_337972 [Pseudomassariella vexata]ORY67295.1 hypothetical protein BCR38DRAFT_337972 [Pseudomassariella vexata]
MPEKSREEYEAEVRSWGFKTVFTWTDSSNAHYSPHSHSGLTTHLITRGQLTISYPEDAHPEKRTYTVGDRVDVNAGRVHEVWIGSEGCTYVIGE